MAKQVKADYTPAEWVRQLARRRQQAKKDRSKPGYKKKHAARQRVYQNTRRRNDATYRTQQNKRNNDTIKKLKTADAAYKEMCRVRDRARKRGVTVAFFHNLTLTQRGACGVCKTPHERLNIDHCHDTEKVRGLLCHHCNVIEGHLRALKLKPAEFMRRLQAYLNNPPAEIAALI